MLTLYTTRSTTERGLPFFPQAELVHRAGDIKTWLVRFGAREFIRSIHQPLAEGLIWSAAILSTWPGSGMEWIFYEWHGRLVITLDLVDELLSVTHGWERQHIHRDPALAIFVPTGARDGDFAGAARRYRELIDAGEGGGVPLRLSWIESDDAKKQLFGRYADPEIGGAIALLSLSGAALLGDQDSFILRTPASLGLEIDKSEEGLISEPVRSAITFRSVGCSGIENLMVTEVFRTPWEQWRELASEAQSVGHAPYFVLVEIQGKHDPIIAVQRGTVFEQHKLTPVQTLAAATNLRTIVSVGEVKPLVIPAYCLNRELGPPRGEPVRPTPFIFTRARGDQQEVWRAREN